MDQEKKRGQKLIEQSKENYRLVVMNNETFEEVGSYQLSLGNIYVGVSALIITVAALVFLLIATTPIKRYIPGYGNIKEYEEAKKLTKELNIIKEELEAQTKYTDNFRNILVGDIEKVETKVDEATPEEIPDSLLNVARIKEDELLRQEIEMNEHIQSRGVGSPSKNNNDISLEQMYFVSPIASNIVSEAYAPEKKHFGIDLMAPKNTPVKAVMDGYVFTSDWTLETGNTIGIQHSNNLISFYKHNSALLKKSGSYVKAGEAIAIIGNTGTLSTGPHLHFELWHNGKAINPENYIIFDK